MRAFVLEVWAVVRVLNWVRLKNAARLIGSYIYSHRVKRAKVIAKPMAFSIEPTSICNLKCPECPTGANLLKRPRGTMHLDLYQKLLDELAPELLYLNLYIQGEPLMHPHFATMVEMASKYKLYVSTSTNGHFMNDQVAGHLVKAGLTRIIFSIDGATQGSYEKYRVGGKLEKVRESISLLTAAKKIHQSLYPLVIIQFIAFAHNEHEIDDVRKLAKTLGVDKLEIKTAQLNDFGDMQPPRNKKYSRYTDEKALINQGGNQCWRQWHSATATWDGKLAPCCYDKDADHAFGDLNYEQIDSLWKGDKSIRFKQQIFTSRQHIKMCQNCPEGKHLFS